MTRARLAGVAVLLAALLAPPLEGAEKLTPEEMLERLPRRVEDKDGTQGDMVNVLFISSRSRLKDALKAAGWVEADRSPAEAAIHAALETWQKKPYLSLPMSDLHLLGRKHDYGFARAEPYMVVAQRHHFRVWKLPWKTPDGKTVWAGSATHDIGFEKDQRSGKVTHQIDPEVDKERDFIAETLKEAGKLASSSYLLPANSVREATTAHGGPYHSDGRLLVMALK